ncbi:hypothetical protein C482_19906 [Natrialba chahannaoensis JCM 10990]|uniref:DUF4352 domain-containing protein n=1 Tax=Natrialba chahannaoensis JCM 10990 TaxID=1227492 RepID=M0A3T9_9EURY|nr:DUF4352 domain-containing protein [Natrialba chahannaoensis]ELY93269.1 hypothetical protein C482_19906 [Natrialba chahannaoensis JCM 10990]
MERPDRRTYLAAVAGSAVAIAGCFGDGPDDPSPAEADAANATDDSEAVAESDLDEAENATTDDSTAEDTDDTDDTDDPDETTAVLEFDLGQQLEIGDLAVVVSDLDVTDDIVDADGEVIEMASGSAVAVVDIAAQYTDTGTDTGATAVETVDDVLEIALLADEEPADPLATPLSPLPVFEAARLAPGEVIRTEIGYEVDADVDTDALVLELEPVAVDDRVRDPDSDADADTDADDDGNDDGDNNSDGDNDNTEATSALVTLSTERDESDAVILEQELPDSLGFSEAVEHDGLTITVDGLQHGNNLGGFMQSDEGHEIVAVSATVENTSTRDRELTPVQVQLTDELGRSQAAAPGVLRALADFDGVTIDAGETYDGTITYQIETGIDALYWMFDFGEWGTDRRESWQLR